MKLMAVLLMAGLLTAVEMPVSIKDGCRERYINEGKICDLSHRPLPQSIRGEIVLVDSGTGYSMWSQIHECLAFNPNVGGLQFVNRNYSPTGVLNAHQTNTTFSLWIHDYIVYNQGLGPGRYPSSVAGTDPYISFPALATMQWGTMGGVYETGGWWSSFWDSPVDLGPGNVGVHRVIGKVLPDGNVLFVGITITDMIIYCVWDPGLTNQISSGTLASGAYYWGFDINGGIVYIFYYDPTTLDVYYQTTTDGVTWSGEQTYNIPLPNPYTNSILSLTQMAVTDAGDPIFVFDVLDNDDTTYPYNAKTYVITESGTSPIQVSDDTYDVSWYPTIATGGDYAVVLMHVWTNTLEDSLARHDLFIARSSDNGTTWRTPVNITSSFPSRLGLGQIAKRLDTANSQFFYAFAVDMVVDHDPIYNVWLDPEGSDPMAFYVCREDIDVGILEETRSMKPEARLMVYPNPFSKLTHISFGKEHPDRITHSSYGTGRAKGIELKIYDASGRLVKNFNLKSKISNLQSEVSWNGVNNAGQKLPCGVYFIQLGEKETTLVKKVIKLE